MHKPTRLIDMHTHMFNARYLPLRGIAISKGVPEWLAAIFAKLSWSIARVSDFDVRADEMPLSLKNIWEFEASKINLMSVQFSKEVDAETNHHAEHNPDLVDKYASMLAESSVAAYCLSKIYLSDKVNLPHDQETESTISLKQLDEIESVFQELHLHFGDADSAKELENISGLWIDLNSELHENGARRKALVGMVKRFFQKISIFVEDSLDFLDFAWNMTKSETNLLRRLQNYYTDNNIPFVLVHHMMDIEYPYRSETGEPSHGKVKIPFYGRNSSDFSQLSQMRQLALRSQGTLLGFSAFDPTRFLNEQNSDEEIIKYLQKGMSNGMVGFKFYPPMGFKPARNTNSRLEHVVDVFLDYCVKHDICIFSHCTPKGFELSADRETGLNAHPKYWRSAVEKPGRKNLRLCLGHAGGGYYKLKKSKLESHGWLASSVSEWNDVNNFACEVVRLCREYPNVYCELANIDVILTDTSARKSMAKNLRIQLTDEDVPRPYALKDKIMYGTDWHMVGMVNDLIDYFDVLLDMFNQEQLIPLIEPFFYGNALRYLKNQNEFANRAFLRVS